MTDFGCGQGPPSEEFVKILSECQYFLQDIESYEKTLQAAGFSEVGAKDITARFVELNQEDLTKLRARREDFLSEFDESEVQHLIARWEKKIRLAETDNLKWFMFKARKASG